MTFRALYESGKLERVIDEKNPFIDNVLFALCFLGDDRFFFEKTKELVKILDKKWIPRIALFRAAKNLNSGHFDIAEKQLNAFKEAIKISKGDLIFLLDSDDYFNKEKIEKVVNYFENNKKAKIVFDYPLIVESNKIYAYKNGKKVIKTYWPYIHPTSCISIRKDCFKELLKVISYKDFTDVWLDLRICLFSKYFLKDFHIFNENLTFYRKTASNISSKFRKFSKNWWKRRKQAHQFFKKFSEDNGLHFNKNFDFVVTKIICKFL